jgi:uncharacterized protein involved in tolerance to divalent cations
MQNNYQEENTQVKGVKPAKQSKKMKNSSPLSIPQSFNIIKEEDSVRTEKQDGETSSVTESQNIKVIMVEDTVITQKEDEIESVTDSDNIKVTMIEDTIITQKEFEDTKSSALETHENSSRTENKEEVSSGTVNNFKCDVLENTMKINGDLNLTINCPDQVSNLNNNEVETKKVHIQPYSVIWISAPTKQNGIDVATLLLQEKLVSSVNIMEGVTTMNMKDGKIETVNEVIVKMKTETSLVPEIIKLTDEHFKNKLAINDAEILSTTLKDGNLAYFKWVSENTKDSTPTLTLHEEQDNNLIRHSEQVDLKNEMPKNLEVFGKFQLESQT